MKPNATLVKLLLLGILISSVEACSLFRKDPASLQRGADEALARGDTVRAIKLLDILVTTSGTSAERFAQTGSLYRDTNTITGRLKSQKVLERGLQEYPDDAALWLEMGKTHYAQTFYGDAARCFKRVLSLDPANCDANLYLGLDWYRKWKYIQLYKEYLARAIPHFQRVVKCDPDNPDGFYRLALSTYARGDTNTALAWANQLSKRHSDFAEAYLLQGSIAYQRSNWHASDSLFAAGFLLLTDEEAAGYQGLEHLLENDISPDYEFGSIEKRRSIERVYWAERDPDPTTPLNERYLEHVQRMYLADTFFDNETPRLRGWETERGKALVKFGWPDGLGTTLAGESLSGQMEVWWYSNEFVGMSLVFRDEFLNGNYMVPMDYRYSYAAQTLYLDPPASRYLSPYWEIPGLLDAIAFRGSSDQSADLYLVTELDLATLGEYIDFDQTKRFVARTAFFDETWERTASHADTVNADVILVPTKRGEETLAIVKQYSPPFDSLHIAFCLEDDLRRTQTILSARTSTSRFLSNRLTVSDVLLYHTRPSFDPSRVITRAGSHYLPAPGGVYLPTEKLRLYLEIYNLDVTGSYSDYEITYSIYESERGPRGWAKITQGLKNLMGFRKPPEPVISQTLQRQGNRHDANERLAVDIDALEPDDYVLEVVVRDLTSGETARTTRGFFKATTAAGRLAGER